MKKTNMSIKSIKYWAEEDRPREKLLSYGRKHITNAELLALILGSGTYKISALDIAKNLLHETNNDLRALSRLSVKELTHFNGIGPAKAANLLATFELGNRIQGFVYSFKSVTSSYDAYQLIRPKICDLQHEEFWIIILNRSLKVLSLEKISSGGVASVLVDAKIVFNKVLSKLGSAIILCHNHPSGKLKPSQQDIHLTNRITEAAKLLDIIVSDHIIVTYDDYYSFADEGML